MTMRVSAGWGAGVAAFVLMVASVAAGQDGKMLANPVPASAESVSAGEKTYQKFCRSCHGKTGGGSIGPSLIDETWDHGSTDGEIFTAIQKGTGPRMESWEDRIDATETWNLVNYLRALAKP